jgi:hypothetical protein
MKFLVRYLDSPLKNVLVGLVICLAFSLSVLTGSAAVQTGQFSSEEAKILE